MITDPDAFGQMLAAHLAGETALEVIERDDGYIAPSNGAFYLSPPTAWPPYYLDALRQARGRVLDIGCGAGRHALYLQEQGLDVLGIDVSPRAIEVCLRRGLRQAKVLSLTQITSALGVFDTVVMLGNNFGLFGSADGVTKRLRVLHRITATRGRIIAESLNPYLTADPDHLAYHQRNRDRGRMAGQIRMRVRFRRAVTPWFDYLFVSPEEMSTLIAGTGWTVAEILHAGSPAYIAVLEKR